MQPTGGEEQEMAEGQGLVPLEPVVVDHGRAVVAYMPREQEYNPMGSVHGGVIATVLDTAMGYAVYSLLAEGDTFATTELRTSYRRPVTVDSGPLRVEAGVLHQGRETALAEGRIVDAEGRLFAHATATWSVVRAA
jgi:uncharacterized protein (TIGR00369 family)